MYDFQKRNIENLIERTTEASITQLRDEVRAKTVDVNDHQSQYPILAGHLLAMVESLHKATKDLFTRVQAAEDRCKAFSWAAECTLTDETDDGSEVWEKYYESVDVIEYAIKRGGSDEQLRLLFGDGVTEEQIQEFRDAQSQTEVA